MINSGDDMRFNDILNISNFRSDNYITIKKNSDINYYLEVGNMLNQCSSYKDYVGITTEEAGGNMSFGYL